MGGIVPKQDMELIFVPLNAKLPIFTTEGGMAIEVIELQSLKAVSPIVFSEEGNLTCFRA